MPEKTALIITYSFPPMGGIAVQRPLKFVKYIRQYGWEPVVLTTHGAYSATMDKSLLQDIPEGVAVERVADPVGKWIGMFVGGTAAGARDGAPGAAQVKSGRLAWIGRMKSGLKTKLKSVLKTFKQTMFIPDESVLWALRAAWVGRKLVRKYNISCVYTTSGPNSTHLAGWMLRKWTGVPWVADFRDPWVDNIHYAHAGMRDKIERWMERKVFQTADTVVTVTDSFREMFVSKYPERAGSVEVIRNGVDPMDFPTPVPPPENTPFTFFYAGILYPKRSPDKFLQALSVVLRYRRIRRTDVRVEFAGVFDYPGKTDNSDLVQRLGLSDVVTVHGYLPRSQVLERMQAADALLLIGESGSEGKQYVPGKLYEYLFAGRPIMALLEDGEAAQIIREANAGLVIHPRDVQEMADAIVQFVRNKLQGIQPKEPNIAEVAKYSRIEQTGQLVQLFHRLTEPQHAEGVVPVNERVHHA
jgi:glycosyltransferase involved in cell wall biosynthesis